MTFAVGTPLDRADGRPKITGAARYAAEVRRERLAYAVRVRATVARGEIESIDAGAARRAPGVIEVFTHHNAPRLALDLKAPRSPADGHLGENLLPLSDTAIHFAGQDVALVVAASLEEARHAAALVAVRYREEVPLLDLAAAAAQSPGKPAAAPGGGEGGAGDSRGDVAGALAAPDLVQVRQVYTVPVETNNPMEPSATVAEWQGNRLVVWDSTQSVIATRNLLAKAFAVPRGSVRVVCPYTGGGFGCKGFQWQHTLLAAMAARALGRPVQLNLTRSQMFTSVGHRPPIIQTLTLAARRDGTLAAMVHETVNATSPITDFGATCGAASTKILYACANVATPSRTVRVNVAAPTPMRAPSECPASFALESAMDELAWALAMDPLELRLRNYAERDPATGKAWSSKHLRECYGRGAERFGWHHRKPAVGAQRSGDDLVGWGMATAFYPGSVRASSARLRLTADGRGVVSAATQELGTGSYTIFAQVAADQLGLPVERVTCELGDSDLPEAPGSGGSCTAASVSEAIVHAGQALKAKLADLAARGGPRLGAGPGGAGGLGPARPAGAVAAASHTSASAAVPGTTAASVVAAGTPPASAAATGAAPFAGVRPEQLVLAGGRLFAAADPAHPRDAAQPAAGVEVADLLRRAGLTAIEAEGSAAAQDPKHREYTVESFGAMFCEVRIDPLLPRVRVSRVVAAVDVGRILNPKTARSQVLGGVTMGLGMALFEATHYDPRSGWPVTDNLADYLVPVNADVESIEVELVDRPDPHVNTLGCRGVGEIGITGVAAAVANAVYHATGRRVRDLPITIDKLL